MSSRPRTEVSTDGARIAAVLGDPVEHSLSPVLHHAAFTALGLDGWDYRKLRCTGEELPELVEGCGPEWIGFSVTMPGKHAALAHADSLTGRAYAVGAANTLLRKDHGWHADCTDVSGITGALRAAAGFEEGHTGVVLGAGGTAAAAVVAFAELGFDEASIVVREPARAEQTVAAAERAGLDVRVLRWDETDFAELAGGADALVSTVPSKAVAPIAAELAKAHSLLDVIYDPWPTPLGESKRRLATGLDMLLHQAFEQVEQFTGEAAPKRAMRDALRSATGEVLELPLL